MTTDQQADLQPEGSERIEPDYPKDRTTIGGPRLGLVGWVRWVWRQLTSMRTALALLLLLAVAALPGSVFPQRGVDAARVRRYLEDHPDAGPWLDRLGMFDVYSSPWFASIYLLLMISLVGCIIPRIRQQVRSLGAPPPRTPRNLERLPVHRHTLLEATPAEAVAAARAALAGRRFRLRAEEPGALVVSAEKGYLKETGNILFHLAILGVIVSVAVGHLFGWRGEIIVKERETFTSGAGAFDTLQLGPLVDEEDLPVFSLRLDDLDVQFEAEAQGAQFGQPRVFRGVATVQQGDEPALGEEFAVNHPLHVDGTSVYLLGNGYAPVVTVRDADGQVVYQDAVTFLPQDNTYSSSGAIKVTGLEPNLGFVGGFFPTFAADPTLGMVSSFPDLVDPALVLTAFEGDLFPEGRAQSVFSIDTEGMTQLMKDEDPQTPFSVALRPGESVELPGGRGTIEMESVIRWGGLLMRHDPGRLPALLFAGLALVGLVLMLGVKRRRVFVRVGAGTHTEVTVAGLPKGTDPGLEELVERILAQTVTAAGGRAVPADDVTKDDR
ncbi:cytochrome c biogenesis protein ResB [Ornithinimicrobium tianjinense]|uniref:Cytochrome c biogenesis protein ResB n=1 Tax=Ornithinimicrobium tianjinense TaxID=1195761 RepID=A0A917BGD6_9MICO|nr:cytochrome c biogenesis protein ResB [Ornithinimicrobium tianjinense]GGF38045.1 cytochrome c biogenesis protein ResB [Ornithinimicrobium tianjinense]